MAAANGSILYASRCHNPHAHTRSSLSSAGVFFLFGQGRLHLCRSQPAAALGYYQKALEAQNQYRNLHHISFWEMAVADLALWEIGDSLECWRTLASEATVRLPLPPFPPIRPSAVLRTAVH